MEQQQQPVDEREDESDTLVGECRERTPYAALFLVQVGGRTVWRCGHDEPHETPV